VLQGVTDPYVTPKASNHAGSQASVTVLQTPM
jgi:hypothetical protein